MNVGTTLNCLNEQYLGACLWLIPTNKMLTTKRRQILIKKTVMNNLRVYSLTVGEQQLCCYRILNALYALGTSSSTFVQR